MTLNELRYVVAIAQEKSFGRAAQRCFVSQPALSVAIQKLEEELGTQLFERGKSEVTVTPVGERIVEQAQKVLEEATRIRDIAQAGRNQLVGLFRLGVIYTVAPYLLPDLIPALNERAPQMPLEIEENLTEHLEAALKTGRIDAAIIALPFQPPGVLTEFLYEEPFQVVVPQQHRWAKRKAIQPSTPSCSTSATAFATRCSTPAPSSIAATRPSRAPIRSRRSATWSPRASACRCCRATR
jgi:LysR family hydrogen peroxide-inducible transcriptional activator